MQAIRTMPPQRDAAGERRAASHEVRPDTAWPTELFVLRGQDVPELRRHIADVGSFLSRQPGVALKDLASSINAELQPGGSRLAIVAATVDELKQRLERADQRLADPACKQIKDQLGIYYFAEPLALVGKIAFLLPGEGAQYLNMLADLAPHFPEVEESLAQCQEITSSMGGKSQPLSEVLFPPADASREHRKQCELALRGLGNAMMSVLIADWALHQLLSRLGLVPDFVAGHSAGELAALWCAGSFDQERLKLDQIGEGMLALEAQDDCADAEEAVLLALGTGRDVAAQIIDHVATVRGTTEETAEAFLAMDNCPHQTVLVGKPAAMAVAEAELQSRGLVFERLSLNRPYHTRLFEPSSGPVGKIFEKIEFRTPQAKIYSCTTAAPFPSDPEEIRRLAMAHWSSPVEFTNLVRRMHDDGARIFIEAGPRGNLSAFAEDILRGRPCLVVAANTQRRPGLTQLNHLAGQLAAHQVPLKLDHLYTRRNPQRIEWHAPARDERPATVTTSSAPPPAVESPRIASLPPAASQRAAVLNEHWQVMQQFLDAQTDVMQQYLARRQQPRRTVARRYNVPTPLPTAVPQVPVRHEPPATPALRPMCGEIVRHEPGKDMVTRRKLELSEDLFANMHTVGGREVSRVDPQQFGLPVMPMTFTLETMAEAAERLLPGKVVQTIKGVRLMKWLAFDEQTPTSIEVTARVRAPSKGETVAEDAVLVAVEVKEIAGGAAGQGKPPALAATGTVVLGSQYLDPPAVEPLVLSGERPCSITIQKLYNNLFHGDAFVGVDSLDRYGREGIQAQVRATPRAGLFASNPSPRFILDPVLMDIAMHPLAGWHLEEPDQSGRVLLPFELERLDIYGPIPAEGQRLTSRGYTAPETPRQFAHGVDLIDGQGRLLYRLRNAKYWRFYIPFGETNFHGAKDEYFISQPRPQALPPALSQPQDGGTPRAWCVKLAIPTDLMQANMQLVVAHISVTRREMQEFRSFPGNDRQRAAWLFDRMAAKDAARSLWHARHGVRLYPADIELEFDAHGRPQVSLRGQAKPADFPTVAFAHVGDVAMGLATFAPLAGIEFDPQAADVAAVERCAKSAVAKALGAAEAERLAELTIRVSGAADNEIVVDLHGKLAAEFSDLAASGVLVHIARDSDGLVAVCLGERASA